MGLLDGIIGQLGGQGPGGGGQGPGGGGGQNLLLQALLGMLAGGGLQKLLQGFSNQGLGSAVQSWVSTGANQPVSPDQIRAGLGDERISQLSQQTGMDPSSLASQLSQLLPGLVDKLTPDGQVPDGNALDQGLGALRGLLK
jgi:uncharacterized protein YidB (DUF937 family)